eukprot:PITA_30223
MLDAKIILPLRYSNWVANLVPVRKNNGEIRLCVDFRNLNKASLKDNYTLPKIDQLIQMVSKAQRLSMLDGFLGYNKVNVNLSDREKIAFTMPSGTFMYARMPFGLSNVGATFQRVMDVAFTGQVNKFVVIYLDDITVFSKSNQKHLKHLIKVFDRHAFDQIKKVISKAPTLTNPDYTKPFSIFSFTSETTLDAVVLQKNEDSHDPPIAFFSKVMRDVEIKYDIIEKQAYALIQALKSFKMYVLHSPITTYVPNGAVKIILTQHNTDGKRGRWITQILEFDLTIKMTKLVKG